MTLIHCYDRFISGFDPQIAFEHYGSGTYRIKLTAYNMYLTILETGEVSWGGLTSNNMKQVWEFIQTTATIPHTLEIYECMNQKYDQYDRDFNDSGCSASCVAIINGFYGKSPFPFETLIDKSVGITYKEYEYYPAVANYNGNGSDEAKKVMSAKIVYIRRQTPDYSKIKSELDNNRPVMIIITDEGDNPHYVVAYGYKNSCTSSSDIFVVDPYGANPTEDVAYLSTINESMARNGKIQVCSYCITSST